MKYPRPPQWVIENYLPDYLLWVSRSKGVDEEKGIGGSYYEIDWASMLGVQPRFDLWHAVEERVYGDCLMMDELPGMGKYIRGRERRLKLF